jgi:hypothetical protein
LQADQAGNSNYLAAAPATRNVTILPAPTVTTIDSSLPASSARTNQAVDVDGVGQRCRSHRDGDRASAQWGGGGVELCGHLGAPSAGVSTGSCTLPASSMKPRDGVNRFVASVFR